MGGRLRAAELVLCRCGFSVDSSGPAGQQMLASIVNRVPMGRFGTPDEIAKAAVFLASDDSTFVTATELFVDGGAAQI
jgi:NAD(P)-dependent dehydrogenase (short-subunit alcohol dehydrogenase family)